MNPQPADVWFTDMHTVAMGDSLQTKLRKLMLKAGFGRLDLKGRFVAVKLHFGEPGNLAFLRANYARTVCDLVKELGGKPFVTDCNTLYVGGRKNALDHLDSAYQNGYNPFVTGVHTLIADGLKGTDDVEVPVPGGRYVKAAKIGRAVMDADVVISLNHFKGHECTGFGGAIKNIGMGCGSRAGKMEMHAAGKPTVDHAKCVGCHNGNTTAKTAMGEPIPNLEYNPKLGWGKFSESYLALHPYVRRNGPEGDYHILNPLEFHASTSDLYQILKKGHHGVILTPEEWDRLITWIDLNVPYYGTWTERGVRNNMIDKRRELEKTTSNLDFDPERVINPYKPGAVAFQKPTGPTVAKAPAPQVAGWPFDGAAKQGKRETLTLDLGGNQSITLVKIPAGSFVMGSNDETNAEAPAHAAAVEKPFYMGTTEVTMGMMQQFDPTFENGVYDKHYKDQVNRGYFVNGPDLPAIRVSYDQAQAFCDWLSKKTGKKVRLPTETEWEYACRAGTATPMNYGDFNADFGKHANLADVTMKELAVHGVDPRPIRNPDKWMDYEKKDPRFDDGVLHLAKVGSYLPNAFGLHDMHGNVAEWTSSPFVPYQGGPGFEGADPALKVIRGGSWYQRQIRASSANRWGYPAWQHPYNVGFRVVVEE